MVVGGGIRQYKYLIGLVPELRIVVRKRNPQASSTTLELASMSLFGRIMGS